MQQPVKVGWELMGRLPRAVENGNHDNFQIVGINSGLSRITTRKSCTIPWILFACHLTYCRMIYPADVDLRAEWGDFRSETQDEWFPHSESKGLALKRFRVFERSWKTVKRQFQCLGSYMFCREVDEKNFANCEGFTFRQFLKSIVNNASQGRTRLRLYYYYILCKSTVPEVWLHWKHCTAWSRPVPPAFRFGIRLSCREALWGNLTMAETFFEIGEQSGLADGCVESETQKIPRCAVLFM